jgi:hypothetical protein
VTVTVAVCNACLAILPHWVPHQRPGEFSSSAECSEADIHPADILGGASSENSDSRPHLNAEESSSPAVVSQIPARPAFY